MYDSAKIRSRIGYTGWAFAFILATEFVIGAWLLLAGWPLHGWLRGFSVESPGVVAVVVAFAFGSLLYYHRPRPLPDWAMPDDWTVLYGLGLAVFCGIGIVALTALRVLAE